MNSLLCGLMSWMINETGCPWKAKENEKYKSLCTCFSTKVLNLQSKWVVNVPSRFYKTTFISFSFFFFFVCVGGGDGMGVGRVNCLPVRGPGLRPNLGFWATRSVLTGTCSSLPWVTCISSSARLTLQINLCFSGKLFVIFRARLYLPLL